MMSRVPTKNLLRYVLMLGPTGPARLSNVEHPCDEYRSLPLALSVVPAPETCATTPFRGPAARRRPHDLATRGLRGERNAVRREACAAIPPDAGASARRRT